MNKQVEKLGVQESSIANDILDFIDENQVQDFGSSISDLDARTCKMESFRSSYRSIHKELNKCLADEYEEAYQKSYENIMRKTKHYITDIKCIRKTIREEEMLSEQRSMESKRRSLRFQITEIKSSIQKLHKEFGEWSDSMAYEEILMKKSQLPPILKEMESISLMFRDIMQSDINNDDENIKTITENYYLLITIKDACTKSMWKQVEDQELLKEESFSASFLHIKLGKFIGYDSKIDIYTFQSNFHKIHRALPKGLLPDLHKNNYLDGPALLLVKNVDEISEIWRRLKLSYGDPKLMLNKKLADLSNSGHLWRIKDLEKLIEGISKIINSMKDMIKLAGEHHIEQSLYHGDGLERIYNLLGDSRLTRWFSDVTEKNLREPELWVHLISFLEKEVKVQQQKLLHGCNSDGRKIAFLDCNNQGKTNPKARIQQSSHHT